ncbi:MAG: cyclic di-AMP synthase CdaA [Planctomycetota bacterium]|nr:MAG: cyclic di-AMP synthase CdaA [Planctomycetota bacterium]
MQEYIIYSVEILLIYLGLFVMYKFVRGSTADSTLRGVAVLFSVILISVYLVAGGFGLYRIETLLEKVVYYFFIAVIVVFAPELRRGLTRIGQNPLFNRLLATKESVIPKIVQAVFRLSRGKTGALIAIERGVGLRNYAERGVELDANFSPELLDTIFYPGSALHDGAVIMRGSRLLAAGCLFPLTENPDVSKRLGTRHRAGLGLSEDTDALVIVVSEETGQVSVAQRGELQQDLSRDQLERLLREALGDHGAQGGRENLAVGQA